MNRHLIYEISALIVVAIWGMTFISTKVLINNGMHPAQIFTVRFLIAYIGIWAITALRPQKIKNHDKKLFSQSLRDELMFVLLGISGGSVYFLLENTALEYTQACNVSFIVCSTPLITTLLTMTIKKFFRGRYVAELEDTASGWKLLAGTLLAFLGMALIIFNGYTLKLSPKGDLLAIGAALCWGIYSIFMNGMTVRYGAMFATRKVFFYGLLTIIPFMLSGSESHLDPAILSHSTVWINLLFLGVAASLLCFVAWNKIMVGLGNVTATNHVYLNPIFTLIGSIIFLDERMSLLAAAGSACILAGVVLSSWKSKKLWIDF